MNLSSKIEALLFWKGEPISKNRIITILECKKEEFEIALKELNSSLENRGLVIIENDDELEIRTAPQAYEFIEKITKEELIKDLGKSGLETLSIILYKGPIKRSDIDYIRGVNSSFILRNLLIRGLIERVSEKDGEKRGFLYKPTINLLAHLGIAKLEDLPEYEKVKKELEDFNRAEKEEGKND